MAVFSAVQPVADCFFFWLPLYYEAKLALAVYLWANGEQAEAQALPDAWMSDAHFVHAACLCRLTLACFIYTLILEPLRSSRPD